MKKAREILNETESPFSGLITEKGKFYTVKESDLLKLIQIGIEAGFNIAREKIKNPNFDGALDDPDTMFIHKYETFKDYK